MLLPFLVEPSLAGPPAVGIERAAAIARSDERLGARLVLPGDLDRDGHDDLAATCGHAVCLYLGPLKGSLTPALVVPVRTAPTDYRAAALAPAGDADRDGRAELWIDGVRWEWPGVELARLPLVPIEAGFDADRDGADDVLASTTDGRVVLTFGPFTGSVGNDPDAPDFARGRSAVLASGGDLDGSRAWWLPDALGPGRGAVAAQCVRDDGASACPGNQRTLWWAVPPRGVTLGPDDAVGRFDQSQPAGTLLASVGDLDGDGRAEVLADDGFGEWALAALGDREGRLISSLGPGGPLAAADLDRDGRSELVVGERSTARISAAGPAGSADRSCGRIAPGFSPDRLVAGPVDGEPTVVVSGRSGAEHLLVVLGSDGIRSLLEASPCGR